MIRVFYCVPRHRSSNRELISDAILNPRIFRSVSLGTLIAMQLMRGRKDNTGSSNPYLASMPAEVLIAQFIGASVEQSMHLPLPRAAAAWAASAATRHFTRVGITPISSLAHS